MASLDVFVEVYLNRVGKWTERAGEDLCHGVVCVWGKEQNAKVEEICNKIEKQISETVHNTRLKSLSRI